jgi:hypothetical protein
MLYIPHVLSLLLVVKACSCAHVATVVKFRVASEWTHDVRKVGDMPNMNSCSVFAVIKSDGSLAMALTWQKLLGEVQGLHDFVEAQKTIMDKPNLEKLMQAHVDQISARSSVSCSAEDAKLFTSLVSKGPWTEAQKQRLAEWCSKMLLESSPTARKGNSRRPGQVATSFAQYFSGKDVDILGSDATLALKVDCITTRMKRVGLHLPTEQSWRPIMQAAQVAGMDVGNEKNQVDLIKDLKAALHKKKDLVETHLVEFPSRPQELAWFAAAYDEADGPRALDEREVISKDMTLRGSKKAARAPSSSNPKSQTLQLVPNEDAEIQHLRRMGMAMQWAFGMMQSEHPDALGSAPGFRSMGPAKRQKALTMGDAPSAAGPPVPAVQTLALKDVEANAAAAKDDAAPSAAGGAEPAVTKQVEAQDALLETPAVLLTGPEHDETHALKRPAASCEAVKPHAPIKKKPAAAQKVVAKAGSKSVAPKKGAKPKTIVNCKKGWVMEIRERESGQKDKHYKSPDGTMYRILSDAVKNGFPGQ